MTYRVYTIPSDALRDRTYAALVRVAPEWSAAFVLIARKDLGQPGLTVLAGLQEYLLSSRPVSEWPGTKSSQTVQLNKYSANDASCAVLLGATGSIWDWQAPKMPEDLSFLREDGSPLFVSIAHEREAYFKLSEDERARIAAILGPVELQYEAIDALPEERY